MATQLLNSSTDMMSNRKLADYRFALKTQNNLTLGNMNTTNVTCIANHGSDLWVTMTRIEALVLLAGAFLLFLSILGSWRRQSKNFFIQKGVFLTYTLSSSVISYTLGSMQSSPVKSSMYPIWTVSLYFLLVTSVDTTAYSLTDHKQSIKLVYRFILDLAYALLISISISSAVGFFLVYSMVLLVMLRFCHRLVATMMAIKSLNMNKMVADYMENEHSIGRGYDPCEMEGYRYLVDWPLKDTKLEDGVSYGAPLATDATQVVDIEKVWKLNKGGGPLSCSNSKMGFYMKLRDACLSFSLFHLLRRRFFGFACGEASQRKTRDFVFKGLLLDDNRDIDCNRVFKVIEVELAFMYDFFFTKHAFLYYGSWVAPYWSLVTAGLMCVTAYATAASATRVLASSLDDVSFLINSNSTVMIDMAITMLLLACVALLEVLQQFLFWTSIWGRVSLVCQYVREEVSSTRGRSCWCVKIIVMKSKEILAKVGAQAWNQQHYWRDKLDQYSLLESVGYSPIFPVPSNTSRFVKCLRAFAGFVCLTVSYAAFHPVGHRRRQIARKPGESVKLSAEVRKAIVQSLVSPKLYLTNGKSALVSNEAHHLSWALSLHEKSASLKRENQAITILTWHIATDYCRMAKSTYHGGSSSGSVETELQAHVDVATELSRYCAYLVVSAPKLLPGHHFDTAVVFDQIAAEASDFLGNSQNKYERMTTSQPEDRFFHHGVSLGKQLQEMEERARWKVLAEFWAEMLLYLAPSDNVQEHIERLASGGEFITHLWALLTHAGILDRGARIDIENNAGADQPDPASNQPAMSGDDVQRRPTAVTMVQQLATSKSGA